MSSFSRREGAKIVRDIASTNYHSLIEPVRAGSRKREKEESGFAAKPEVRSRVESRARRRSPTKTRYTEPVK